MGDEITDAILDGCNTMIENDEYQGGMDQCMIEATENEDHLHDVVDASSHQPGR